MLFLLAPSIGDLGTVACLLLILGTPNCPPAPISPVLFGKGRALNGFTVILGPLGLPPVERRGAVDLKEALTEVLPKLGYPGEVSTRELAARMVFSLMELRRRERWIFLFSDIPISLSARLLLLALTAFFAESRFLMMLAATEEVVGDWRNVVESWKRTWEVEWGGGGGEGGRAAFFSASSFITLALAFLISLVVSGLKSIM